MSELHEVDVMTCRACGNDDRASEGYPCESCGTFICLICHFRGVTLCKDCQAAAQRDEHGGGAAASGA
jgi:hypothetical protein